jgi:hypothetical protein
MKRLSNRTRRHCGSIRCVGLERTTGIPNSPYDQENLNILRDAAHLQSQLRIYEGLVDTRHTILKLRPSLRQNWIALAVAYHLNGSLPDAKKVLEQYEYILKVHAKLLYALLLLSRHATFRMSRITTWNIPRSCSTMSVYWRTWEIMPKHSVSSIPTPNLELL